MLPLPVPKAAKWLLFEASFCSAEPFPDPCAGLGTGARFCLACSAISCHFDSMSLPPTACRAATFAAVVLILSSSSLLGCKRLGYQEKKSCQSERWNQIVTFAFFGRLSSFSLSNSAAPLPSSCHARIKLIEVINTHFHEILQI
jgi:hypothetical protein